MNSLEVNTQHRHLHTWKETAPPSPITLRAKGRDSARAGNWPHRLPLPSSAEPGPLQLTEMHIQACLHLGKTHLPLQETDSKGLAPTFKEKTQQVCLLSRSLLAARQASSFTDQRPFWYQPVGLIEEPIGDNTVTTYVYNNNDDKRRY